MRCGAGTSLGDRSEMDAIVVEDLVKRYGRLTALDGISFTVHRGEFFGFLGPNGAGKTTTVRILTGILPPDSGQARINGYDITRDAIAAKGAMGIVPEMANVYIDLTAWGNMMLMGELYGVPRRVRRQRAQQLLTEFGLWERRNDRARTFSKGMRQRLLLAMALVNAPQILFLDEPTSGLDVNSALMIRKKLVALHDQGMTIFLTTHNLDEANRLCQRVAIINRGRIIAIDPPEVLRRTASELRVVEAQLRGAIAPLALTGIPGVRRHEIVGDKVRFYTDRPDRVIKGLVKVAEESNAEIMALNTVEPSLEEVFLKLTGTGSDSRRTDT